jgi:hypothetical protein
LFSRFLLLSFFLFGLIWRQPVNKLGAAILLVPSQQMAALNATQRSGVEAIVAQALQQVQTDFEGKLDAEKAKREAAERENQVLKEQMKQLSKQQLQLAAAKLPLTLTNPANVLGSKQALARLAQAEALLVPLNLAVRLMTEAAKEEPELQELLEPVKEAMDVACIFATSVELARRHPGNPAGAAMDLYFDHSMVKYRECRNSGKAFDNEKRNVREVNEKVAAKVSAEISKKFPEEDTTGSRKRGSGAVVQQDSYYPNKSGINNSNQQGYGKKNSNYGHGQGNNAQNNGNKGNNSNSFNGHKKGGYYHS